MRWCLLLLPSFALAQPTPGDREADIFGSPPEVAAPASAPPPVGREADIFGAPESKPPEIKEDSTPTAAEGPVAIEGDPLTIGGRLWLRSDFSLFEDTDAADQPVRMPNLLDVFLDARPVEGVRAYASGRLVYDPTVREAAEDDVAALLSGSENGATLDELWLRFDLENTVFFTLGAQHIRWGTGRIWNPTDVLNQARRDPLAPTDLRTGAPLMRAEVPIEVLGGALQVVGRFDGADHLGAIGGATRLQAVFGSAEVSVMAAARDEAPTVLGLDFSAGLGPLDVYAEAAVSHGSAHRWTGTLSFTPLAIPTREGRDGAWIPQVVAGVEWPIAYGDDDVLYLGAEYFFNDSGYSDADIYPWLLLQQDFSPFYLGRHYAGAYALLAAPGTWNDTNFVLTGLMNLSDRTAAARLNISHAVRRRLFVEPYVAGFLGDRGGEFRFAVDLTVPEALLPAGTPAGAGRIVVPPPVVQAGLWLRVPF